MTIREAKVTFFSLSNTRGVPALTQKLIWKRGQPAAAAQAALATTDNEFQAQRIANIEGLA